MPSEISIGTWWFPRAPRPHAEARRGSTGATPIDSGGWQANWVPSTFPSNEIAGRTETIRFRSASKSFAAIRRLIKRELQTLHLLTEYQGLTPRATCKRPANLTARGVVREVGTELQVPRRRCYKPE